MSWNHRVILHRHERGDYFEVHEVYYNEAGVPDRWTRDSLGLLAENMDELRSTVAMIQRALDKPILEIVGETLVEVPA